MGLGDIVPDEEDSGSKGLGDLIDDDDEEEQTETEEYKLPLLIYVDIEAENFAEAVKLLRESYQPQLNGILFREARYMKAEIPEDINEYRK